MELIHGSNFTGIGGFDLAAEWMGWINAFHCEWNPFCHTVLNYYWPNAKSYYDIKQTDFTIWRNRIDILTGGFPCQPYSQAGKRLGTEDERHLWPEMLRSVREIQPRYVVGENVPGLINWNKGLVFEEVQADLENEGYEVWPVVLPSCGKNTPHKRERVWFVAYSASKGLQRRQGVGFEPEHIQFERSGKTRTTSDTFGERLRGESDRLGKTRFINEAGPANDWENFPTQHPICSGNDGLSSRLDGITFREWKKETIQGYGNAIVPQVAFEIFKAIEQTEIELNLREAI